jgi:hypothetical protein
VAACARVQHAQPHRGTVDELLRAVQRRDIQQPGATLRSLVCVFVGASATAVITVYTARLSCRGRSGSSWITARSSPATHSPRSHS